MTLQNSKQIIQEALGSNLRPFITTAPLKVESSDKLDTSTIYLFEYDKSFIGDKNRPQTMITYLESLGSMFDIIVPKELPFEEKEKLIMYYFDAGTFFNVYSLIQTMIHIMFMNKGIKYEGSASILTNYEVGLFLQRNEGYVNKLTDFYNSIFLIMLLYASSLDKTIKSIRDKFGKNRIIDEEFSPNVCTLLMDRMFYKYYEKHVGKQLYYYSFLFDNNLYNGKPFLNILTNKNNTLLPVIIDMNNPKFLEFINEKCEKTV